MKNIFVTVDVESYPLGNTEDFIFGKTTKGDYGIEYILEKFKKNKIKATFFISSLEYLNQKSIKKVIKKISEEDFEIGVHTHPANINPNKPYMFQWTLKEQIKIIKKAKDIIEDITGEKSSCHRAGTYGADINTLDALIKNNIYIDSSLCYNRIFNGTHVSILDNKLDNFNISKYKNLIELPLTRVSKQYKLLFLKHTTVDNFNLIEEKTRQDKIFNEIKNTDTNYINCILHSFDFVIYDENHKLIPNYNNQLNFDYFLKQLKNKEYNTNYLKNVKKYKNLINNGPIEINESLTLNRFKSYLRIK